MDLGGRRRQAEARKWRKKPRMGEMWEKTTDAGRGEKQRGFRPHSPRSSMAVRWRTAWGEQGGGRVRCGRGMGGRQGVRSRAVTMYGSQDPLGYDRGGSDEGGARGHEERQHQGPPNQVSVLALLRGGHTPAFASAASPRS